MPPHARARPKRRSLSLDMKIDIIRRIEAGERQAEVGRSLNLAGSTVRTIIKNADKIKHIANPLKMTRYRNSFIERVEQTVGSWVQGKIKQGESVSYKMVTDKAKTLFTALADPNNFENISVEEFLADKERWENFMKRMGIKISKDTNGTVKALEESPETVEILVDLINVRI